VHLIATELGYRSPSAFGAMVKRAVGVSPGQFLASA
jgi:AraC-like DNA-binding protein